MRPALTCAAVFPPGSSSHPSRPNWFVVSITILPSSGPAAASTSSTATQGTANITTSPNSTAARSLLQLGLIARAAEQDLVPGLGEQSAGVPTDAPAPDDPNLHRREE